MAIIKIKCADGFFTDPSLHKNKDLKKFLSEDEDFKKHVSKLEDGNPDHKMTTWSSTLTGSGKRRINSSINIVEINSKTDMFLLKSSPNDSSIYIRWLSGQPDMTSKESKGNLMMFTYGLAAFFIKSGLNQIGWANFTIDNSCLPVKD